MNIKYRQGLLGYPANFLQASSGGFVNLFINDVPVLATVTSGQANYLIAENRSVSSAWGPFSGTTTQHLYWDINKFTGALTRGATSLSPVVSAAAPPEIIDQHWWDTTEDKMKRWTGSKWEPVIRVFAATLSSGAILTPQPLASQVGLNDPSTAGYILTDGLGGVFRNSRGEFLTSDTPLTSIDTGSLVKFEGSQITAVTNESIPQFSLVYYIAPNRIAIASGSADSPQKTPFGVVVENSPANSVAAVITAGRVVTNEFWNWPNELLGQSVYCDELGGFTTNKLAGFKNMRVGVIVNTTSILLTFDWETDVVAVAGGGELSNILVSAPLVKSGSPSTPLLSIPRSTTGADGYLHKDDFARIVSLEQELALKADIEHGHVISDVEDLADALAGKAAVEHTQPISSIDGLELALSDKADVEHNHEIADVSGLTDALAGKADVEHNHEIADVSGLTEALGALEQSISLKVDKVEDAADGNFAVFLDGGIADSELSFNQVSLVGHNHEIADVSGLTDALAGKADVEHTHQIADVTGLTEALAGKADVEHNHEIADVSGLTDALAGKADVEHIHEIADVTGLTEALAGKAATSHTHVIAEVTGLQLALDSKIAFANTSPFTPSSDYNPASKLYVDSRTLDDLSNVSVTAPTLNQVLTWDGSQWVAATSAGGGSGNLPPGGAAGTYLEKASSTDYDAVWTDRVNAKTIYETVKNVSGVTLPKGTPVYKVGIVGNTPTVGIARADDPDKLAMAVLDEELIDEAEGRALVLGEIKGVDTSTFATGDFVYLGATGGYTNVKPTLNDVAVQFLGVVFRVGAAPHGSGYITGSLTPDLVKFQDSKFYGWNGTDWIEIDSSKMTVKNESSNYSATLDDGNGRTLVRMTASTPVQFTIPAESAVNFPIGSVLLIGQAGIGQVEIVGAVGVTVNSPESFFIRKQHGKVSAIKVGTNEWDLEGNLQPL